MTFETRKKLAKHYLKLGLKKHPYVLEMKKNKGDNPATEVIEEPFEEIIDNEIVLDNDEVQEEQEVQE